MSQEEARLREAICETGRSLHARGYVHSSAGDISAHLGDGFLITTTDASQITSIQPSGIVTELPAAGVALTRPECVLATR